MATAEIDGRQLARALRRIARVNRGLKAEGTFTLRQGELQIDWGNGGEVLEANCSEQAQCHLAGRYVRRLPKVLRGSRQLRLEIRDGRLFLDRFSIDAFVERNPQRPLLPPSPRHIDFLLLPFRYDEEEIDEAGLRAEVELATNRLEVSVEAIERKLKWLQIDKATIESFIHKHLETQAATPAELPLTQNPQMGVMVDGQFSLFD